MQISTELTKYSVTLPAPSVSSGVSTVVYPAGLPMNTFDFLITNDSGAPRGLGHCLVGANRDFSALNGASAVNATDLEVVPR
jgi:hypothetical protein